MRGGGATTACLFSRRSGQCEPMRFNEMFGVIFREEATTRVIVVVVAEV